MAGHSRRFKDAGHDLPKFLLDCGDKKMIEHVLAMFSESDIFHCILNSDFLNDSSLKTFLYSLTPNMHVYFIEPHELGPTHTVAIADLKVGDKVFVQARFCNGGSDVFPSGFWQQVQEIPDDHLLEVKIIFK